MKHLAAILIACVSTVCVAAEDADITRLVERPFDYLVGQIDRGINVVYMGKSGEWHRFDFFIQSRIEGAVIAGSIHGRYRCRDLALASNTEAQSDLASLSMVRVVKVDAQKREVVLDVKSFSEAIEKAIEEMERRGEPDAK
jgi:hypothetical protein